MTVRSQHIAILTSNITNSTDSRPVLTFYAQLDSDTVVSSDVVMMAVEVRKHSWLWNYYNYTLNNNIGSYRSL